MNESQRRLLTTFSFTCIGFAVGLVFGAGMQDAPAPETAVVEADPMKNECRCGDTRTCPFGPGIVGQQKCWTSSLMGNGWTRCEPAPKESE